MTSLARNATLTFRRMLTDERGASAVEYALVASGIGAAIAAVVFSTGSGVKGFYSTLAGLLPGGS